MTTPLQMRIVSEFDDKLRDLESDNKCLLEKNQQVLITLFLIFPLCVYTHTHIYTY